MLPCLTLNIIREGSSVKWSNPEKGLVPSLHLRAVAIEKGAFGWPPLITFYIYIYVACITGVYQCENAKI